MTLLEMIYEHAEALSYIKDTRSGMIGMEELGYTDPAAFAEDIKKEFNKGNAPFGTSTIEGENANVKATYMLPPFAVAKPTVGFKIL